MCVCVRVSYALKTSPVTKYYIIVEGETCCLGCDSSLIVAVWKQSLLDKVPTTLLEPSITLGEWSVVTCRRAEWEGPPTLLYARVVGPLLSHDTNLKDV